MTATITSLADHAAAKESARIVELDRAIMERAKHIRRQMDTEALDPETRRVLADNLWELYR